MFEASITETAHVSGVQISAGSILARRYRVEREISRGGMSTIVVARDLRHDRDVAIKLLPPVLAAAIGVERFRREIAITSRLSHPHILPLHDSGEIAGTLYYVMPYIDGESLGSRIARHKGGMVLSEVLSIVRQVAEALDYAHGQGVIHRDVTPNNVLLAGDNALLADFGVARLTNTESTTESGLPFGTAKYRSPEQAAGHAHVSPSSDVYSLACVVYEALAGENGAAGLSKRFSVPVPPVRKTRPEIPSSVDVAIERAMSLTPAGRYQSSGEFVRALTSARRSPWPMIRRTAAAGLLMVVAAFLIVSAARKNRNDSIVRNRVFVGSFDNRTQDKSLDAVAAMTTDYIVRGLAETEILDVVDSRLSTVPPVATNAAAFITGSVYKRGETLHVETRITDPKTGRLLVATDPVEGPEAEPTAIAERIRQRLMGNFAAIFGSNFDSWQHASLPPSYQAYEEILAGDAAVGENDYGTGLEHYRRAASIDTAYVGARALEAFAGALIGNCKLTDSVASALEPRLASMSALDRGRIEWSEASCRNDVPASLNAAMRVLKAEPHSVFFTIMAGITAINAGNPREAIQILSAVNPGNSRFTAAQRQFHTSFLADALHELGDYRRESELFRQGLTAMPDEAHFRTGYMRALAAQGKVTEVNREVNSFINGTAHYDRQVWNPAQVYACIAAELLAHGHPAEAATMFGRADGWFSSNVLPQAPLPQDVICATNLLMPSYYAGDLVKAKKFYSSLIREDSASEDAHIGLGAIAARLHDTTTFLAMDAWLAGSASFSGRARYARARQYAIAGDLSRARALLDTARRLGRVYPLNLHFDPDMKALIRGDSERF